MLNATFSLLFIGAPVFFLGIALAFRRSMFNRRKNAAPFRGYFASGNDRDFFQHSDLSEAEDWRTDLQARFTPFRLRNPEIDELRERNSRMMGQDPESL
jgi:hypothetical protein